MKLCEAIERTDSLIPNRFDQIRKIEWLSEVDGLIFRRILCHYAGGVESQPCYDEHSDKETVLLVPAPHDQLYLHWLEAKIAHYNGESERYENAYVLFNNAVQTFAEEHHRTHLPRRCGTWKW